MSLEIENDKGMHPRVCCFDLTYPKVACFGGIIDKRERGVVVVGQFRCCGMPGIWRKD